MIKEKDAPMNFIIATNNPHKLTELQRILTPLGISAFSAKERGVSLDEVEETGSTFEENAYLKAHAACQATGLPAIADDSGLAVDALNGAPGIYSARYAGEDATNEQRIAKLLGELDKTGSHDRGAKFVCAVCCVFPNGDRLAMRGECRGTIGLKPAGDGGFGYDPVFIVNGDDGGEISFAQLPPEQKDAISHRGEALRKMRAELERYFNR